MPDDYKNRFADFGVESLWKLLDPEVKRDMYCGYPDREILELYKCGSHPQRADAFRVLYQRHSRRLLEYLYRSLDGNRDDVLDTFGEVWIVTVEALDTFNWFEHSKAQNPLLAWLLECARRRIQECYRQRRQHQPLDTCDEAADRRYFTEPSQPEGLEDSMVARLQTEDGQAVMLPPPGIEECRLFRAVISHLGPDEQKILKWKFNTNMTNEQLASEFGKTTGAFKTALSRAVRKMRDALDEHYPGKGASHHG